MPRTRSATTDPEPAAEEISKAEEENALLAPAAEVVPSTIELEPEVVPSTILPPENRPDPDDPDRTIGYNPYEDKQRGDLVRAHDELIAGVPMKSDFIPEVKKTVEFVRGQVLQHLPKASHEEFITELRKALDQPVAVLAEPAEE